MRIFAYIDAGTGSLFIQAVLGVALASMVFLRNFFRKFFDKIRMVLSRRTAADEEK